MILKRLTINDLDCIKASTDESIHLIKIYASQYISKEHYDILGASCVSSVVSTINILIGSSNYLDGHFLFPDQVNVEKLATWFLKNKNFEVDPFVLKCFIGDYLRRKVNEFYKHIKLSNNPHTIYLIGHKRGRADYRKRIKELKKNGAKLIMLN